MSGRPRVLVVAHRRHLDTPLGLQRGAVVYEGYLEHLERAGALPLITWPGGSGREETLDVAGGVLLVGGGDVEPRRFGSDAEGDGIDPARDEFEVALVRACRDQEIPLLAMCRGAQVMNVALGGTLRQVPAHRQDERLAEPSHPVSVERGSRLGDLVGAEQLSVNSFHRWAVDRPAPDVAVTVAAPDGTAEGIECTDGWWAVGVQWHAELIDDARASSVFRGFVSALTGRTS